MISVANDYRLTVFTYLGRSFHSNNSSNYMCLTVSSIVPWISKLIYNIHIYNVNLIILYIVYINYIIYIIYIFILYIMLIYLYYIYKVNIYMYMYSKFILISKAQYSRQLGTYNYCCYWNGKTYLNK